MPQLSALFVLTDSGDRIAAKYFPNSTLAGNFSAQKKFESEVFRQCKLVGVKDMMDVVEVQGQTIVFRGTGDALLAAAAPSSENTFIVSEVLDTTHAALITVLKGNVDARHIQENLELLLLVWDETVDAGVPIETSHQRVVDRVLLKDVVPEAASAYTELTVTDATRIATEVLKRNFAALNSEGE